MELKWNVYRIDSNLKRVVIFNIFDDYTFAEKVKELIKECTTIIEFGEHLKNAIRYSFAWKFEYEIMIGDMFGRVSEKIDIRHQLELNWTAFIEYLWKYRSEINNDEI